MTVLSKDDPAAPEPLTDEERAEIESYEWLVYALSVALMRLDGNDGDPHHLVWCGGTVPEPWGDAWQKYEPQALSVLDAIGEASARALVEALPKDAAVHGLQASGAADTEGTPTNKTDSGISAAAKGGEAQLREAMRRAFSLGQTYWQQADSDFTSQHRKSDATRDKFLALVEETVAAVMKEKQ